MSMTDVMAYCMRQHMYMTDVMGPLRVAGHDNDVCNDAAHEYDGCNGRAA